MDVLALTAHQSAGLLCVVVSAGKNIDIHSFSPSVDIRKLFLSG